MRSADEQLQLSWSAFLILMKAIPRYSESRIHDCEFAVHRNKDSHIRMQYGSVIHRPKHINSMLILIPFQLVSLHGFCSNAQRLICHRVICDKRHRRKKRQQCIRLNIKSSTLTILQSFCLIFLIAIPAAIFPCVRKKFGALDSDFERVQL